MPTPSGTPHAVIRLVQTAWRWSLALGIIAVIFGMLALFFPGVSTAAAGVFFGIYLFVLGISLLTMGLGPHVQGASAVAVIMAGIIVLFPALMALLNVGHAAVVLGVWIGAGWMVSAVTRAVQVTGRPEVPGKGLIIALSLIEFIGGLVMVVLPVESVTVLVVFFACVLVVIGGIQIAHGLSVRRIRKVWESPVPPPPHR